MERARRLSLKGRSHDNLPEPITTLAERTLTKRHPAKWLAETLHCRSLRLSIVIAEDAFDLSELGRLIPPIGEEDFKVGPGATGPLRLGGRGRDDFRITATVQFHNTEEFPHYHVAILATVEEGRVIPKADLLTIPAFFGAIVTGVKDTTQVGIHVEGEHSYPRTWWKGAMDLPVPLPSVPGESHPDAELTGIQVSYTGEIGTERVSVGLEDEVFTVSTEFFLREPLGPDLFAAALRRSAAIAGRLFGQDTRPTNDE